MYKKKRAVIKLSVFASSILHLSCYRYFDYPVKFILKDFVCFFDVFEGEAVGNKRGCEIISIPHHNGQFRAE